MVCHCRFQTASGPPQASARLLRRFLNREVGQSLLRAGIIKKSGAEHSIQRHSSSPTGLSGGCAKPIVDHAYERSAKRQAERGLMLRPLSSNLPYRSRSEELRLRQRRKKSVWVRSL